MTELSAWFAFFPPFPTGELFKQLLAAGVGTAAFSVLFYVPRKYYGFCAACGAWGWLTYFVLEWAGMTVTEATFFAAAAVVFLSRLFAVMERCPATLFMIPDFFSVLFPLSFFGAVTAAGLAVGLSVFFPLIFSFGVLVLTAAFCLGVFVGSTVFVDSGFAVSFFSTETTSSSEA